MMVTRAFVALLLVIAISNPISSRNVRPLNLDKLQEAISNQHNPETSADTQDDNLFDDVQEDEEEEEEATLTTISSTQKDPGTNESILDEDPDVDDEDVVYEEEEIGLLEGLAMTQILNGGFLDRNDIESEAPDTGTKTFGIFGFAPNQILTPISDKLSEISDMLTHPNGFSLVRPGGLWNKLQETGAHIFGSGNGAIFGLGQFGQHDYPFPYRKAKQIEDVTPKTHTNARDKLNNYKDTFQKMKEENKVQNQDAYKFPYMLSDQEIRQFVRNVSKIIEK